MLFLGFLWRVLLIRVAGLIMESLDACRLNMESYTYSIWWIG